MGVYMFFGCQTHLVHDNKWGGYWVLSNFHNFPLSDHGVHFKILQITMVLLLTSNIGVSNVFIAWPESQPPTVPQIVLFILQNLF